MSVLQNKIFYINSENRSAGSSSNFSYKLDIPPNANYDYACVLAMTIPKTYYLIRDGYNTFRVTVGDTTTTVTIPPGNYGSDNFAQIAVPLLNTAVPAAVFTMTKDRVAGKYIYTCSQPCTFEFYSQLAHQFGFDEHSIQSFAGGDTVRFMSKNVLNFISTSTLYLHSDIVDDSTSILQEVYSDNSVPFSNIVYNCRDPSMYSKKITRKGATVFNFTLTDEHQQEVFLNGNDICVTLLLYKRENLTGLFTQIFDPPEK